MGKTEFASCKVVVDGAEAGDLRNSDRSGTMEYLLNGAATAGGATLDLIAIAGGFLHESTAAGWRLHD